MFICIYICIYMYLYTCNSHMLEAAIFEEMRGGQRRCAA